MLRQLAVRQSYQRFDGRQPALDILTSDSPRASDNCQTDVRKIGSSHSEFINVPDDFKVQIGAKLTENLFVGKPLGCGLQVHCNC